MSKTNSQTPSSLKIVNTGFLTVFNCCPITIITMLLVMTGIIFLFIGLFRHISWVS
jgi:hypothetical protein